ncbi:anaerobic sulfatase maturase [Vibrio methylphosphonaticus]|uniref:anaerobic sulfatase maturase n=1 Tax=Vibrio methylphosphonaticus TaxID=2946866 RepID=UPI002029FC4E|nr:anaerobic sulfatase maturase [Vibrio methylphosphonaticus]MCL9777461.1 anaerobic sulfatase maturase [Vibrio methylphosphonaticus]
MNQITNCHVMAKPSGSVCNIDCDYCFYLEKEKLYPDRQKNWRMDDATLEAFIKQYIAAQQGDTVQFAWQGGEPTLLGVDFYRTVIQLCERYRGNKTISHAFQTNGILINDEWCELFKQANFLIGVSIDGPEDLHDAYRTNTSGKGTHSKVVAAIELLKKHQVEFNTLTVVNDKNVKHPLRVYQFLKSIGSNFIQFIPLVERQESDQLTNDTWLVNPDQKHGKVTPWSVQPDEYGQFLNTIFDYWVTKDVGRVFVQQFDTTLTTWLGQPSPICVFAPRCGHAFAIEANGDLFQCDHYVYPEYKLGNIHDRTILSMNNSEEAINFGLDKSNKLNSKCQSCRYRFACHGGCPKHRFLPGPTGELDHNYLCEGYFSFFDHSQHAMAYMAKLIKNGQSPAEIMAQFANKQPEKVGRNDACPCGSGNKYKRCCA